MSFMRLLPSGVLTHVKRHPRYTRQIQRVFARPERFELPTLRFEA